MPRMLRISSLLFLSLMLVAGNQAVCFFQAESSGGANGCGCAADCPCRSGGHGCTCHLGNMRVRARCGCGSHSQGGDTEHPASQVILAGAPVLMAPQPGSVLIAGCCHAPAWLLLRPHDRPG